MVPALLLCRERDLLGVNEVAVPSTLYWTVHSWNNIFASNKFHEDSDLVCLVPHRSFSDGMAVGTQ